MCGRYALNATPATIQQVFRLRELPSIIPRYNIAPSQDVPTIRHIGGEWWLVIRLLGPGAGLVQGHQDLPAYLQRFWSSDNSYKAVSACSCLTSLSLIFLSSPINQTYPTPRNGCCTLSAKGRKLHVDRSLCRWVVCHMARSNSGESFRALLTLVLTGCPLKSPRAFATSSERCWGDVARLSQAPYCLGGSTTGMR
jgi:hypothetical protein